MPFGIIEIDGVTRFTDIQGHNALSVNAAFRRSASTDGFNRLRTSSPITIFDSKHIFDDQALFFSNAVTGAATVTRNADTSSMTLQTTTTSGDKAVRQTKRYFNYQPGKSHLIMMTFNLNGAATNVRKRAGYFDVDNGFFLELLGSGLSIVKRTNTSGSPVDTAIAQSSWNVDMLDGTGASGKTLDTAKTQLLVLDFQWLGVGSVRVGFVIDGEIIYAHEFHHANMESVVYIREANLPIRFEVENTGTASGTPSLDAICATVISEGGQQPTGTTRSADRGTSVLTTDTTLKPVIAIRTKSSYLHAPVFPLSTSVIASTNANFRWAVIFNPTITGGSAASWQSVANSAVEYDITRTGTVSGGIQIGSGYSMDNLSVLISDVNAILALGTDLAGVTDEIVVAVQSLGASEDFLASITWMELP